MNYTYNITPIQSSETVSALLSAANDAVTGHIFGLFMFAVFFVMLLAMKNWDFDDSLFVSSFSCFLVSAVAVYGEWLNFIYALVFLALLGFTALYMYVIKRG